MTKLDMSQFKPIPGFDSLKWKQEVQTKIYEETKDMTSEEVCEYFRKGSEEFREEQRLRRAERAALAESADK